MKSVIKFIKKFDIFFIFFTFAITISSYCFFYETSSTDELWNYQNVYKMYNGFKIYKDCNVIITPLFFVFGNFLFNIISPNMITFKFYNLIIYTLFATSTYCLFKKLGLSLKKSLLFSTIVLSTFMSAIDAGANYNILSVFFVIIGSIFLLNSREKKSYLLLNGVAIYLVLFTKQNVGAYYIIGTIFSELLLNKDFKITVKRLFIQAIPAIILSIFSLFVMYKYDILYDFINYTILGINEFSISNIAFDFWGILLVVFIICIYSFIIWIIKKGFINNTQTIEKIKLLICISIPISLIVYPILNLYHFLLSLTIIMIILFYILDFLIFTPILDEKLYDKLSYILTALIIAFALMYSILNLFKLRNSATYFESTHPYYNCYFTLENIHKIEKITNYIKDENSKGVDVIILSYQAALYMIPLRTKPWIF